MTEAMEENDSDKLNLKAPGKKSRSRSSPKDMADGPSIYGSYVGLYANLDNLIWKNLALGVTVALVGGGAIWNLLAHESNYIFSVPKNFAVSIVFFAIALLYATIIYVLHRICLHFWRLDTYISRLEPAGYFRDRLEVVRKWWLAAPVVVAAAFSVFLFFSIVSGVYFLVWGGAMGDEEMNRYRVEFDEAFLGLNIESARMENGELRFRVNSGNGNGYVRTSSGPVGSWQNSHLHASVSEMYIVEDGWIAIAEIGVEGGLEIFVVTRGEYHFVTVGKSHNVYVSRGTIMHTIKVGADREGDWTPDFELDKATKNMNESEILRKAGR